MKKSKYIIQLDDVWKIYKMGEVEVPALQGMSLGIKHGEFAVIMGPSGSGKSTAMHMVGCLDLPTRGRVILDGEDIKKMSESQLAKIRGKKIGFVFQTFNLLNSLNAIENVTLPMTFQKVSTHEKLERAKLLLEIVGLQSRMYHRPTQLSGGERQRVAIARALANDPEIILADEPTGNLDSKTGMKIIELLVELHKKEKKTLVLVTHDPRFEKLCHGQKIYFLEDGRIKDEKVCN